MSPIIALCLPVLLGEAFGELPPLGILGVIGTVVLGTAAWILKYKNDQLNYLFTHFRTELETTKEESKAAKAAVTVILEQNAKLREEKASLLAQIAILQREAADQ